ncbi:MAG: acyl-CoA desaturase [Cytophagales bacterium]|nr:acyl-CoA desaturase [Cytophagales bacterium]
MIPYQFSRERKDFLNELRARVADYFSANDLSRNANAYMVLKTIMAVGMFLIPFTIILTLGNELPLGVIYGLWFLMACGKAFIGTSVMHDSLHGSYSNNQLINQLVGSCSYMIGVNPKMWQIQHNVIHHTYTNLHDVDEDLDAHYVLRFSPNQDRHWFHRFQHLYVWFFYCLPFIIWSSIKDFKKLVRYKRIGFIRTKSEFNKYLLIIVVQKAIYFSCFIGLPMYLLGWSFGSVFTMFLFMEAITGLLLSFVFQTAHVMPDNKFLNQQARDIEENWAEHQLLTTTNYGRNSKVLCWFTGGLNFQIEHHLFPNICHIHYPRIADIVRDTAKEYNLPTLSLTRFWRLLWLTTIK